MLRVIRNSVYIMDSTKYQDLCIQTTSYYGVAVRYPYTLVSDLYSTNEDSSSLKYTQMQRGTVL